MDDLWFKLFPVASSNSISPIRLLRHCAPDTFSPCLSEYPLLHLFAGTLHNYLVIFHWLSSQHDYTVVCIQLLFSPFLLYFWYLHFLSFPYVEHATKADGNGRSALFIPAYSCRSTIFSVFHNIPAKWKSHQRTYFPRWLRLYFKLSVLPVTVERLPFWYVTYGVLHKLTSKVLFRLKSEKSQEAKSLQQLLADCELCEITVASKYGIPRIICGEQFLHPRWVTFS